MERGPERGMLNSGFGSKVRDDNFKVDAGPVIYCPHCKKIILEGVVDKLKTRCKHCRKWIFIYKK
jgi:hypothetical protein